MPHDLHLTKNTPAGGGHSAFTSTPLKDRVSVLNTRYADLNGGHALRATLETPELGRIAVVSSFGADSVVLLHMISQIDKGTPVLFIDTQMLFPETIRYQADLTEKLGLWNVRIIRTDEHEIAARDPDGTLHNRDIDSCCDLRKTRPLNRALKGFDGWVTGRKRHQAQTRAALDMFEAETATGRIKINPLARWSAQDVQDYMIRNNLPKHPLVKRGYPSIGCAPCTSPVAKGEDPRSGRWRGHSKTECGIHFADGKVRREGNVA